MLRNQLLAMLFCEHNDIELPLFLILYDKRKINNHFLMNICMVSKIGKMALCGSSRKGEF